MSRKKTVVGALVCCGALALPAFCQNEVPGPTDSLQQEVVELRQLVTKLAGRIDSLERQVAEQRPDLHLRTLAQWQPSAADRGPRTEPCEFFDGTHKGMMIDAIEHRMRWPRR